MMSQNKYLFPVLAAALLCACAAPVKKAPAVMPAPARKEAAAVKLSPEDAQKVGVLYYKAVGAYSNNDMGGALNYLNEISTVSPAYPPAAELRAKIKSVSGSK